MTTIGSLFTGYGGLDLAVEQVTGGRTVWTSDIDPGACAVIRHRFTAPNLGDISAVDWSTVEPVDIITGGFPCQDVSMAGRRAGMRPGNRSGLWSVMCRAIDEVRPRLAVIENVRGLLSADGHADVEPCPWCLGDAGGEPLLRALGGVLGDLADIGYDAAWKGLRAADVGAPHARFRIFIIAWPATDSNGATGGRNESGRIPPGSAQGTFIQKVGRVGRDCSSHTGSTGPQRPRPEPARSETTSNPIGGGLAGRSCDTERGAVGRVAATGSGQNADADTQGSGRQGEHDGTGSTAARQGRERITGRGSGRDASADADSGELRVEPITITGGGDPAEPANPVQWGQFGPAVRRWESLTRPAPAPTEKGPKGGDRLSPRFVEWMMGLPAGWVTDVPGLTRNQQLKALGNGVVPQQAAAALGDLLEVTP